MAFDEMLLSGVDTGRLLYGIQHPPDPPIPLDLLPVAEVVASRIIGLKQIEAGERAGGYGHFRAERPTSIGVLPFGWSDGLPQNVSMKSFVLIRERLCRIIEVHLEHCLVDCTDAEDAELGDEAILFGKQGKTSITRLQQAAWLEVSELQLVIQLARNITRVYRDSGKVIEVDERV